MAHPLFVLNGSNLNMLGMREPALYGTTTLAEIERRTRQQAEALGLACECRQTNHEGVLVDWIQEAATREAAVVINPAGFSFGCVPALDALKLVRKPVIELHLTNIHQRPAPYGALWRRLYRCPTEMSPRRSKRASLNTSRWRRSTQAVAGPESPPMARSTSASSATSAAV